MNSGITFPCSGQVLYDFYGEVIGKQSLVKLTFIDGCSLVYSHKDLLWRTHDPYPLQIFGAGYFNLDGQEASGNILKSIISMEITNNWLGE